MPVNSCHPTNVSAIDRWKLIRDCIEGTQAIKDAGIEYLPMLGSQESMPGAYEAYKERALFFNATNRTHDALLGFLFRKPPTLQLGPKGGKNTLIPESDQKNVDLCGNSINDYARLVGDDVASVGRAGTLIDWDESSGKGRSRFSYYAAERILNWKATYERGKYLLKLLVLEEFVEREGSSDEFENIETVQFRVFRLTDSGVEVEEHRADEPAEGEHRVEGGQQSYSIEKLGVMKRRGIPLMEIPFVFHNSDHVGPEIGISPLYDLACVNKSHYQTSADLENGRHVCGVPTPYAFGLTGQGGEPVSVDLLYLGGPAWVSTAADAKCGFLEFTGAGLEPLKNALAEKLDMMAAIGARMIEPKQGDAEAFETVALRASSETSALAAMACYLSRSIQDALKWLVWWHGTEDSIEDVKDVEFEINRDFVSAQMPPAQIQALVAAHQSGAISYDTLFFNLQRADMYAPGRTQEEEKAAIDEQLQMPIPGVLGEAFNAEKKKESEEASAQNAKDLADKTLAGLAAKKVPAKKAARKTAAAA